jgi:ATP-dependent helicase/nuclease subunit B
MRDPYAVYARDILRLRPLEGYEQIFGGAERGNLLHALFEEKIRERIDSGSRKPCRVTEDDIEGYLARFDVPYAVSDLNRKALNEAVARFEAFDASSVAFGRPLAVEVTGTIEMDVGGQSVTITARMDRIDEESDGGLHIIDYKGGSQGSLTFGSGFSPQLCVAGLIVSKGNLPGFENAACGRLTYLRLSKDLNVYGGKSDLTSDRGRGEKLQKHLKQVEAELVTWLTEQYREGASFPAQIDPNPAYPGDYDALSRKGEWGGSNVE